MPIYALRYATAQLPAHHLGLEADLHDAPGQLDYFIWAIREGGRTIVVDTGFDAAEGARRGRKPLHDPIALLARIGIAAETVEDVVLTHLHYDHAGNLGRFPRARFHLQDAEMAYATGRCMCHSRLRRPFATEDVIAAVRLVFADRMVFHAGEAALTPTIGLHLIGGHSRGLQVVRIAMPDRPIILASDALHLSRYLTAPDVFPMFADYADVLDGYRKLRDLAGNTGVIIPGHDPEVAQAYPSVEGHQDIFLLAP